MRSSYYIIEELKSLEIKIDMMCVCDRRKKSKGTIKKDDPASIKIQMTFCAACSFILMEDCQKKKFIR